MRLHFQRPEKVVRIPFEQLDQDKEHVQKISLKQARASKQHVEFLH